MYTRMGIGWVLIGALMMLPPTESWMSFWGSVVFVFGGIIFLYGMHRKDVKENEIQDK